MTYLIDCRITGYCTLRVQADSLADAIDKWQKEIGQINYDFDNPEIEPISCYKEE